MALFEARNVCKHFRRGATEVRALDNLSLTVDEGSFSVVAGPSASGKTTLLALLGALDRPTRGQIVFRGRDLSRLSDVELARVRRAMGFVFQDFSLIPNLPIWENITYHLIPRGVARAERRILAQALLTQFGMVEKLHMRARELSGGEQQRVAIARALAGQPSLLLADEPTSNLDPASAGVVASMFREIHGQGKTVIVSSHDPQIAAMATKQYELNAGKLGADCASS